MYSCEGFVVPGVARTWHGIPPRLQQQANACLRCNCSLALWIFPNRRDMLCGLSEHQVTVACKGSRMSGLRPLGRIQEGILCVEGGNTCRCLALCELGDAAARALRKMIHQHDVRRRGDDSQPCLNPALCDSPDSSSFQQEGCRVPLRHC